LVLYRIGKGEIETDRYGTIVGVDRHTIQFFGEDITDVISIAARHKEYFVHRVSAYRDSGLPPVQKSPSNGQTFQGYGRAKADEGVLRRATGRGVHPKLLKHAKRQSKDRY
jgi:hypothetical protein